MIVPTSAKSVVMRAVKIRADGTTEDLGIVARWHRNPLVRLAWAAGDLIRKVKSKWQPS